MPLESIEYGDGSFHPVLDINTPGLVLLVIPLSSEENRRL